ncbi:MAG: hypothetical protein U5R14_01800 [Gemmatimonadota bacterium]|nr:hypothetical protein [Gemmatimonadota bacterium]
MALLAVGAVVVAMVPLVAADLPELTESATHGIEQIERGLSRICSPREGRSPSWTL